MGSNHLKHIGVYQGGTVWNFANNHSNTRVISETADSFRQRLTRAYGHGAKFFYGYRVDIRGPRIPMVPSPAS
jgi:hypothetical protein